MIVAAAVVGSGVGALARHLVASSVQSRTGEGFPFGTAVVNLTGALLLGVLVGLQGAGRLHPDAVSVLGTGFCGGFTTFSTWMVESARMPQVTTGRTMVGLGVNLVGVTVAGVLGVAVASQLG